MNGILSWNRFLLLAIVLKRKKVTILNQLKLLFIKERKLIHMLKIKLMIQPITLKHYRNTKEVLLKLMNISKKVNYWKIKPIEVSNFIQSESQSPDTRQKNISYFFTRRSKNFTKKYYKSRSILQLCLQIEHVQLSRVFKRVFDLKLRVNCWAHIYRNIRAHIKGIIFNLNNL
ncbi:hypothetical protein BpHYR1_023394 [Brachionus plicatilis]|uniref:Uncharacterized protein n=1 Tax=Brachionus plicatilis TaxID=10195 RepID=A0A3M7Q8N0_BRAPC|nr:hypothetical protein BpHYR1_023394 [Brachionus plicatilis]